MRKVIIILILSISVNCMGNITRKGLQDVYDKGEKSLVNYRHLFISSEDDVAPADFHHDWSESLINGRVNEAFEAFRESAKSQYVLRAFPLYCLTYPSKKRDYIVIIKNNQTLASNKLKEIETEALNHPLIAPNIINVKVQSGLAFEVDVLGSDKKIHNIRIEAYGKKSSIRGLSFKDRRPKIIICDDLQDLDDVRGEEVHITDWNRFLGDIKFLGQTTRIFMIGNNLGEKCIIERIFNNPEELKFSCTRIPITDKDGNSRWSSKYSNEEIQKEKDAFRKLGKLDIWMRERQCIAIPDETRTFKREYFQYYPTTPNYLETLKKDCNIFMTVDPSVSKELTSDPRAIIVVGIDSNGFSFILDIVTGRFPPDEMIDHIFSTFLKWRPITVGIEQMAYFEAFIRKEMQRRNVYFNLVELKHKGLHKEQRIADYLQPRYKAKTILHPQETPTQTIPWLTALESQLYTFPAGLHDDIVDALAYIYQIGYAPTIRSNINRRPQKPYNPSTYIVGA